MRTALLTSLGMTMLASVASAQSWDSSADFSLASNPNGAWTYGRKLTVSGTDLDVCGYRFQGAWILGLGLYEPAFQFCLAGGCAGEIGLEGLTVWADNNAIGYPALRWTSPAAGQYDLGGTFAVADFRGGDNLVDVVINGTSRFSDEVHGFQDSAPYLFHDMSLQAGDTVDFVMRWDDRVPYQDYGWTNMSARICGAGSGCVCNDASSCDDGNACTADTCAGAGQCSHDQVADGATCDNGNGVTGDVCRAGVCTDAACAGARDGTPCDDGNGCTDTDVCRAGLCVPGARPVCAADLVAACPPEAERCRIEATCTPQRCHVEVDVRFEAPRRSRCRLVLRQVTNRPAARTELEGAGVTQAEDDGKVLGTAKGRVGADGQVILKARLNRIGRRLLGGEATRVLEVRAEATIRVPHEKTARTQLLPRLIELVRGSR
jgi:hypothetical protein